LKFFLSVEGYKNTSTVVLNAVRIVLFTFCLMKVATVDAQHFSLTPSGNKLEVLMGGTGSSKTAVKFGSLSGTVVFDAVHYQTASFDIVIKAKSLSTGNAEKDKKWNGAAGFNTDVYPLLRLKSAAVNKDIPGSSVFILKGNLDLKNTSIPVSMPFTAIAITDGYLFRGSFHTAVPGLTGGSNEDITFFIELRTRRI
jgi:polyisoprenoid-binding protein YceI